MEDFLFNFIALVHCLIWGFVLFAFLNISTAKINLYYIVPFIYILHILPFHVLVESKKNLKPDDYKEKEDEFNTKLVIPGTFIKLQKKLEKYCFCSPISAQGMLIFGAISCAWRLKLS